MPLDFACGFRHGRCMALQRLALPTFLSSVCGPVAEGFWGLAQERANSPLQQRQVLSMTVSNIAGFAAQGKRES